MDEICEKLDDALLEYHDVLKATIEEKARLETTIKAGFLQLSRSRYNTGVKAIGLHQFNNQEMHPLFKVNVNSYDNGNTTFSVEKNTNSVTNLETNDNSDKSPSVRRRHTGTVENIGSKATTDIDEPTEISTKARASDEQNDPIKSFGVLVPHSLRHSQKNFQEAIHSAARLAALRCQLQNINEIFLKLKAEKNAMKAKKNVAA